MMTGPMQMGSVRADNPNDSNEATMRIVLTEELLEAGKADKRPHHPVRVHVGWNKYQLGLLKIRWPPPKKWRKKVLGSLFQEETIIEFLGATTDGNKDKLETALRNLYQTPRYRKKNRRKKKQKSFVRPDYYEYIKSDEWQEVRKRALEHYNWRCCICRNVDDLHVHHLHYKTLGREKLCDLRVLCKDCHKKIHENKVVVISHRITRILLGLEP